MALKAGLVNQPPDDEEGRLYREIARSRPAPQGICVVNSAGKVLNWALMFDDDRSVLDFLGRARERFARYPDAQRPVAAEVHARFPSQKQPDVADSSRVLPALDRHPAGQYCPAEPPLRPGTVEVRVFGRALDREGRPVADVVRQENYAEDRFNIPVRTQEKLAAALRQEGDGPVALPVEVTRQWVKQAYLGVLDVQPLDNPIGTSGDLKTCSFTAARAGGGPARWRVSGESHVFIDAMANAGPGDMHEVKLTWDGFVEMEGNRLARLVLAARGREKLRFNSARPENENEVALLPGGHRVDMDCGVRFGFLGEPAGPHRVADDAPDPAPGAPSREPPDEALRQLVETLGPAFLIFREEAREELRLSPEQDRKVRRRLVETLRGAMQFFQTLGDRAGEQREEALRPYRERAGDVQRAFLEGLLSDEQLERLRQLELRHEGAFALLSRPDLGRDLQITDEQRRELVAVVRELQAKVTPLVREAQSGGNPREIGPRIMQLRREYESRLEKVLTEAQRERWRKLQGRPPDPGR